MPKRSTHALCHWCGKELCHDCRHATEQEFGLCGGWHDNLCIRASTRDHLLPRSHPSRSGKKSGPIVVACRTCNNERGHADWTPYSELVT